MNLSTLTAGLKATHRPAECEAYRREQAEREYAEAAEAYLSACEMPHNVLRSGDRCPGVEADAKCCCARRRKLREARDRQKAAWFAAYRSKETQ